MSPTVLMNGVLSDGDIFGCRREALMEKQWLERVNEQRERESNKGNLSLQQSVFVLTLTCGHNLCPLTLRRRLWTQRLKLVFFVGRLCSAVDKA